jgi:hypothetical protein
MRALSKISVVIAWAAVAATASAQPQYQIYDIGVVQVSDTASQGFGVSNGGIGVGRSFQSSGTQAFSWTQGGGLVGLPNLAGRNYCRSDSANDSGTVVGTGSTTAFGSNRLPVVWQNGVVSQLPLPSGESIGEATGVNASGVAVGSVDGGSLQQGVIYNGASATIITQTTPTGCTFVAAFGIIIRAESWDLALIRTTRPEMWGSSTTWGAPVLLKWARCRALTERSLLAWGMAAI